MIDFTVDTEIARQPGDVFAYVSDPGNLSNWQTNTVSAVTETGGPVGVGTRIREVHSAPGGKELESLVEVSEYEPGRVFALQVLEGTPIHARITFEPIEPGTVMHFRAYGQLERLMRLASPILGRMLQRQFTDDCARLKALLES